MSSAGSLKLVQLALPISLFEERRGICMLLFENPCGVCGAVNFIEEASYIVFLCCYFQDTQ